MANEKKQIHITFAKGFMGVPFQSKNGVECVRISIPNPGKDDHRGWESFVIAKGAVHENESGKSAYVYLPEDGKTRLERQTFAGKDENGKNQFQKTFREVPNAELKTIVEAYREQKREAAQEAPAAAKQEKKPMVRITFSKGFVDKPFTSPASGKECVKIRIPNPDKENHSPWEAFVLPKSFLHENESGKSYHVYLPEDGETKLQRSVITGKDENGKNIYSKEERKVPNTELKSLVEAYKENNRESALGKLADKQKEAAAEKAAPAARVERNYSQIISDRPHAETALQL